MKKIILLISIILFTSCDVFDLYSDWGQEISASQIELKTHISSPNSVGGRTIYGTFKNNFNRTIKYIRFNAECYNRVGDLAFDEITNKSWFSIELTGPVYPGQEVSYTISRLFYSYAAESIKISDVHVEFL